MAVIPFPMDLSPQGANPQMQWQLRSITARHLSPMSGVAVTYERPGAHWAANLPYENLAEARRARFQTFAASCRGHASRFYVPVFGWTRRGSFSATELLTNNTFASGTTGWTAGGTPAATLAASDGILRVTQTGSTVNPQVVRSGITVTQYAPYCFRSLALHGRGSTQQYASYIDDGVGSDFTVLGAGMNKAVLVASSTSAQVISYNSINPAAGLAGDYFEVGYTSLARCALVDNAPNLLTFSQQIDNAAWTKTGCTVSANLSAAPDGSTTSDHLVENSSTSLHIVSQGYTVSSSAADYAFAVAVAGNGRGFCYMRIDEGTGSTSSEQYFNLAAGGSVASGATGANWSGRRAFTVNLGNNWVLCVLVVRKTNAATALAVNIGPATADNTASYLGDGSSGLRIWGPTVAQSSVPTRLSLTTASADTDGTLQTGSALHLKGLPASTDGLLLQGDPVEIITGTTSQLVRVRASLNSDAAGRGYLQFEPPLRVSPSDNAGVIICNPLCKMMLDSNDIGWSDRAAGFSDLEFSAVEDTYPS